MLSLPVPLLNLTVYYLVLNSALAFIFRFLKYRYVVQCSLVSSASRCMLVGVLRLTSYLNRYTDGSLAPQPTNVHI